MPDCFRIVTYNIHKCCGMDRRVRPGRIVEVLHEIDADIVALQEVLGVSDRHEEDHAQFIATELGYHSCFGENRRLHGSAYGNLLLSRYPIRTVQNHDISTLGREQRGCLRVDIDLPQNTLHVFNIHMGTSFLERREQVRKLLSANILHDAALQGPRIVLGDFNEWTHGLPSRLLARNFRSLDLRTHLGRSRTYPGLFPLLHLDHVYFDPALKLESLVLHRTRTALLASDHLPLIADFCVESSPARSSLRSRRVRRSRGFPHGRGALTVAARCSPANAYP